MGKKSQIKMKPWCPFCGQVLARPRPPEKRKLGEFSVGTCQCGAVYTCDATGHNVGAAMVEALVYSCNDDWDLAWDLIPEDDYLTGRIENYDEESHQVLDQKHIDGRFVRGVLYFVRLHRDIAEISERKKKQGVEKTTEAAGDNGPPPLEPERDPKRKLKRAKKQEVKKLLAARDIDGLVDLAFDDVKTLWFMQRSLYDPDPDQRWLTAHIIAEVCRRLSTRKPGPVSDLLHRMFEAAADSAAASWGLIEAIGSIIAARPDIFGAFGRHLLQYLGHESTRNEVLWALGSLASTRPDLIRAMPYYQIFNFLASTEPLTRGLCLRLIGNMKATEVGDRLKSFLNDDSEIIIHEKGLPVRTTVGELARSAMAAIEENRNP